MPKISGIHFDEKGEGSQSVICLHGIGGDSDSFIPQMDFLSKHMRIISWNMPGYKNSDFIENLSFDKLSDSLFKFIQSMKIKKCHLIGQSIGGMIAQDFAILYPDIIQSIVIVASSSAFGGRKSEFKEDFLKARLEPLNEGNDMKFLANNSIPKIVGDKITKNYLEMAINSMANIPEKTYREILNCLVTFDRYEDIKKISAPCCLLAGNNDNNAPAKTMKKMSEKIKISEFHCFDNVGHLINIEIPEETNKIIFNFYESLKK